MVKMLASIRFSNQGKSIMFGLTGIIACCMACVVYSGLTKEMPDYSLKQVYGRIGGSIYFLAMLSWVFMMGANNPYRDIEEIIRYQRIPGRLSYTFGSRAGYVYVIKELSGKYYKIGRTVDPTDRLKTFAVLLPMRIEYDLLIPTKDMYRLETELHRYYADKRLEGEWFALTQADLDWLHIEFEQISEG